MKIAVDTNVLARAVLQDDFEQARTATKMLEEASSIAVSLPCLCELASILLRGAQLPKEKVATAIRALLDAGNVVMNRPAVEAGLAILKAGGETFVSFDKNAVALLSAQGQSARLL